MLTRAMRLSSGATYSTGVIISSKMPRRLRAPTLYSMASSAICSKTSAPIVSSTPSPCRISQNWR